MVYVAAGVVPFGSWAAGSIRMSSKDTSPVVPSTIFFAVPSWHPPPVSTIASVVLPRPHRSASCATLNPCFFRYSVIVMGGT